MISISPGLRSLIDTAGIRSRATTEAIGVVRKEARCNADLVIEPCPRATLSLARSIGAPVLQFTWQDRRGNPAPDGALGITPKRPDGHSGNSKEKDG